MGFGVYGVCWGGGGGVGLIVAEFISPLKLHTFRFVETFVSQKVQSALTQLLSGGVWGGRT